jgi:uncharacterized membrane protein YvbJ
VFCSKCGTKVEGKFCSNCGTESSVDSQTSLAAEPLVYVQTRSATPTAATAQTSGLAAAALVLSFFFPLIGVILGFVARNDISNSKGTKSGEGVANAAIILGFVIMFLQALALFFWFTLFLEW